MAKPGRKAVQGPSLRAGVRAGRSSKSQQDDEPDAAERDLGQQVHGSPPQVIDASRSRRERRTPSSAISPKPAISIAHVFGSGTPVVNWAEPPND